MSSQHRWFRLFHKSSTPLSLSILATFIIFITFLPNLSLAYTTISGQTIIVDKEWSLDGSPYTLTGNITVSQDVRLSIAPGVVVNMGPGVNLVVSGELIAQGTSTSQSR